MDSECLILKDHLSKKPLSFNNSHVYPNKRSTLLCGAVANVKARLMQDCLVGLKEKTLERVKVNVDRCPCGVATLMQRAP